MSWKNRYISTIKGNCSGSGRSIKDLPYWRNNLFAGTIIYLLPFCLIALLPGLYWSIFTKLYMVMLVDILVVTALVLVAFMPGITLASRKITFISCMYTLSCVLLYYIGLSGPGLIYLLAACIFTILIFPTKYSFWPAWINTCICILFLVILFYDLAPWVYRTDHIMGEWVAVSTNLIFLSFLSSALIPGLFNGLQETIDKENQLKKDLNKQQHSLQQALDMLQGKNIELEQFAYVASHDLQEPLRTVTSFLTQLDKKYTGIIDEKGKKYIDFAVDGAKRMRRIIHDLLEFSKSGTTEDNLSDIDLNELINEVEILYKQQIGEKSAIIQVSELPLISSYKVPLLQVFQNLIGNALKYTREDIPVRVYIVAKELENHWHFAVIDNGIGIGDAYFNKIFSMFQRLHGRDEYSGTGIGLTITKKIIENLGGKIWVESEEGKGSTFYFTIAKCNSGS